MAADLVRLLLVPSGDEGAAEVGEHSPVWVGSRSCRGPRAAQSSSSAELAAPSGVEGTPEPSRAFGILPAAPSLGPLSCRLLEEAMSGRYLDSNFSLPCPPGLEIPEEQHYTVTANTLKVSLLGLGRGRGCTKQGHPSSAGVVGKGKPAALILLAPCPTVPVGDGAGLGAVEGGSQGASSSTDPPAVGLFCCVLDFLLHAGGVPDQEQRGL